MNNTKSIPLISVIVPIYKTEAYLERCINSILGQTYKNIELILINDGSPDRCPQICNFYEKLDTRVKIIHKNNEGVSSARNDGLEMCSGEYVSFIDSDDFIDLDLFKSCEKYINKYDVDMIDWGINFVNNEGEDIRIEMHSLPKNKLLSRKLIEEEILPQLIHLIPPKDTYLGAWVTNKLFKREILNTYNIRFDCDIKLWEDGVFTIEYLKYCNNIVLLDKAYYFYRDTPHSLSTRYDANLHKYVIKILKKYQELYSNLYDFNNAYYKEYSFGLANGIIIRNLKYFYDNNMNIFEIKDRIKDLLTDKHFVELFNSKYKKSVIISQLLANRFPEVAAYVYIICYKFKTVLKL